MSQKDSHEFYQGIEKSLYSAVISDILDSMGFRNQAMDPQIRPLKNDLVLVGRARTVVATDVNRIPKQPYMKQIEILDKIQPGDVFVATVGGSKRSAFFGELMATATKLNGGRGAVIDGLSRDSRKIMEMNFPLFSRGYRPTDSLGRVEVFEYDVPIECGGVTVKPNDLIFGDMDGVVVIPAEVEEEVIKKALEKVNGENMVRNAILNGMKVAEAFARYGVL